MTARRRLVAACGLALAASLAAFPSPAAAQEERGAETRPHEVMLGLGYPACGMHASSDDVPPYGAVVTECVARPFASVPIAYRYRVSPYFAIGGGFFPWIPISFRAGLALRAYAIPDILSFDLEILGGFPFGMFGGTLGVTAMLPLTDTVLLYLENELFVSMMPGMGFWVPTIGVELHL